MSDETGPIKTIDERCQHCLACLRHCPVKAINATGGQAHIVADRCVWCGQCYQVCTQKAKVIDSEAGRVKSLCDGGNRVVAILSPELAAALYPMDYAKVEGVLEAVGFYAVEDSIMAEELVALEYRRIAENRKTPLIRSTCPSVTFFLRRYHPELLGFLAPIVSPMIAAGRLVKKMYPGSPAAVYITSCIAQKMEAREPEAGGAIDAVLTFVELEELLASMDLNLDAVEPCSMDTIRPVLMRSDSLSGGFPRVLLEEKNLLSREVRVVRGLSENRDLMTAWERDEIIPKLIDSLTCEGCVDGPAMTGHLSLFARKGVIEDHNRTRQDGARRLVTIEAIMPRLPYVDLRRAFADGVAKDRTPTQEEIVSVLAEAEKYDPSDMLDCGACGYSTCRENAIAICRGFSDWDSCFPWQRELLSRTISHLKEASSTDGLTGLPNHQSFMTRFCNELKRAERYQEPLSLLMVDVDVFKNINDSYGHLRGDDVLRKMGHLIRENVRGSDFVARYGGDEFVVILTETDKTHAFRVAEKLRRHIESSDAVGNGSVGRITVSIGIAAAVPEGYDAALLIDKADKAMYRAKNDGRNQSYIAPNGAAPADTGSPMVGIMDGIDGQDTPSSIEIESF